MRVQQDNPCEVLITVMPPTSPPNMRSVIMIIISNSSPNSSTQDGSMDPLDSISPTRPLEALTALSLPRSPLPDT